MGLAIHGYRVKQVLAICTHLQLLEARLPEWRSPEIIRRWFFVGCASRCERVSRCADRRSVNWALLEAK